MSIRWRVVLAGAIAPPIGITLAWLLALVDLAVRQGHPLETSLVRFSDGLFYQIFFGAPLACFVELMVGVPSYRWLTRTKRLTLTWVTGIAATCGALLWSLVWTAMARLEPGDFSALLGEGFAGGVASGMAFWVIAFARSSARRAA